MAYTQQDINENYKEETNQPYEQPLSSVTICEVDYSTELLDLEDQLASLSVTDFINQQIERG